MREPFRIGLTGGIASGKSTVADMFVGLGVPVIDTDVIAREVVEAGTPALGEIVETFGKDILQASGELDRAKMRRLVFSDAGSRARLEAITHPRIQAETMRQSESRAGNYQLIVVPLLTSSPLADRMDRILVVDCGEDAQVSRLLERDAETESQARKILAAQGSRKDRLAIADDVIANDGLLDDTLDQVRQLHRDYLALAAERRK